MEVELHTLFKGDPDFIGCTSPHHHLLASLLSLSGSLTKFFQRTIIFIHLFYKFVNSFFKIKFLTQFLHNLAYLHPLNDY
jgi:hypothetical protein